MSLFSWFKNKKTRKAEILNNANDLPNTDKKEKVQPCGIPLFVLVKMDWGLRCNNDTSRYEYYVFPDRRVEYQYNGAMSHLNLEKRIRANADDYWSGLLNYKMSRRTFSELSKLLRKFPEQQAHMQACDGTGYELTLYDLSGTIVHTTCGYIYGNEVLEKIARLITERRMSQKV